MYVHSSSELTVTKVQVEYLHIAFLWIPAYILNQILVNKLHVLNIVALKKFGENEGK